MAKQKKWRNIVFAAALVVLSFYLVQRLVMPKYMDESREGAMIAEYYTEEKNHDILFVGDCEVYESISPVVLWEEYGINSYIRGSAGQTIWQSYYLMEESFSYEKPKAVVFNVLAMMYDTPRNEAQNRMTLDGMKWSIWKWKDIRVSMTEGESMVEYLFPILRFHSRITSLTKQDWKYLLKKEPVTYHGYLMQTGVHAMTVKPEGRLQAEDNFSEVSWEYLDKMRKLCEENGVDLILMKAPVYYPYWYDSWEEQIEKYAQEYHLHYYNFLECTEDVGLDYTEDTYDGGYHLNVSGAEKLSRYFGKILKEEEGPFVHEEQEEMEQDWEKLIEKYNREKRHTYPTSGI